jgi:hypothetical protein
MSQVLLENTSDRPYTVRWAGRDTVIPAHHAIVCEEDQARLYVPWSRDSESPASDEHKIGPHAKYASDAEYDRYLRHFRHRHGYTDAQGKPQGFATAERPDGMPYKPPLAIRPYAPQPIVLAPESIPVRDVEEEFAGLGETGTPEPARRPSPAPTRAPARPKVKKGRR